ncbi:hypothetical protein CO2235_U770188 [Cupriavidus oxalaticus]|uniref:Uncharacterized protein n=1 Tax=Cupriavidus oxalaticus TaxID=96344 RepID=A0A375FPB9_9BURK|nr:hypothetical protein CO2235_U770188 [Cupriavidus oxalaticus]
MTGRLGTALQSACAIHTDFLAFYQTD